MRLGLGNTLVVGGGVYSGGFNRVAEVASYGDSITATSAYSFGATSIGAVHQEELSYMYWAHAKMDGRFENMRRLNNYTSKIDFGYSGITIQNLANGGSYESVSPMAVLLARTPRVVVELSGTNNIVTYYGIVAADVAALRIANWDYMLANGVERIIAIAIPPLRTGSFTTEQTGLADDVNAILQAATASRAVTWVPYPAEFKSAGTVVSTYFRDDIHFNHLGAQRMGYAVAAALDPFVLLSPFEIPASGSSRWVTTNPYMAGSVAMNGGGTGVRATDWQNYFTISGALVGSKVTDSYGTWQRLVTSGLTENNTGAQGGPFWINSPSSPTVVPVGTKIRSVARIRTIDPMRSVGMAYTQANINNRSGARAGVGYFSSNNYPVDYDNFNHLFIGPITEMNANQSTNIWFTPAGNGTIDIATCGVITVP